MARIGSTFELRSPTRHAIPANLPNSTGIKIESQELVGIEVEVENVTGTRVGLPMWSSTSDGSLRNNGVEFITHPIAACDAPASLELLMKHALPEECCFSPRTSIHVHLNMVDDESATAEDIVLLYAVFERLFFKFAGRRRIKNIYCVPITETDLIRTLGVKGLSPGNWQKYTALNLRPLSEHGTLEFRHMHGTNDVTKLSIWIDLITKLKTYCLRKGTKAIRQMLAVMDDNMDFESLLKDIFGDSAQYLKYEGLDDVRFTYPVAKLGLTKHRVMHELAHEYNEASLFYQLRTI